MPRPKFYPKRPAHVTVGAMERRGEKTSMRQQRVAPDKPKPVEPPKQMSAPNVDPDYNAGG